MVKINEKKYKNAILFFAHKIRNGTLGKLKLMKLLYFLDFDFFELGRGIDSFEFEFLTWNFSLFLDHIKEKITPEFKNKFNGKGYVFLGWAEPGLVYLFAQKPIKSASDMTGVKLWAWEGDPLADAMIKAFKVTPVHISLPDVLMALQTGMLTAVYAPPMAAMALQWHTKVKYMMNEPLTNSTGGALVTKKQWDKISAEDQATVMSVFKSSLDELTIATRKQNVESIDKFKELGIKIDSLSKLGFQEMTAAAAEIRPQLVGKLYSADLLKRVESLLSDLRKNKKSK